MALPESVEAGNHIENHIREVFRRLRKQAGLTQGQLAREVAIKRETYCKWENCKWERGKQPNNRWFLLAAGFLCTCLPSDTERQELIRTLVAYVPESAIMSRREQLLKGLSWIQNIEDGLSKIIKFPNNS